jgi:hypothetical protein
MIEIKTDLAAQLSQFTGTISYYRLTSNIVLTDGTKYLADTAGAYWLMSAIASYLPALTDQEDFVLAKLRVTRSYNTTSGLLTLDDGNDHILAKQFIEYTDFVLDKIKLYACWTGDFWVIMLPSEY